ncbi:lipopolysaccharide assembly protein LapA domain-containing protein [Cognatiluteimonas profundi]|uniref:lipopolysaccharide assembly protein LapA domain-containing protein n=1 Tax=Cognatiluteimonas profundi TaxID=2594501 RepID=UPI00131B8679|nr:LapA family protein [Lysobacter profundi]
MRLIRLLVALSCLAVGIAIGALNAQPVALDMGFTTWHATLGVCVLVALLIGVLIGGLVISASVVLPLRRRLRLAGRPVADATAAEPLER